MFSRKRDEKEWDVLLQDLLTSKEYESLAERWQIVQFLHKGVPQRDIAEQLGVSISKITRGSKVLQEGAGGILTALGKKK